MSESIANFPHPRELDAAGNGARVWDVVKQLLMPLASLKITVVLFAMATFIVFAGTVAQIDKGIWTVVDEYFRCAFAWIDLQIFFPRAWNVPGGFWFPGGWLIGGLLLVNIIAAHLVRFRISTRGGRLVGGLGIIAAGSVLTWMIIAGFFDQEIAATEGDAFWRVLWRLGKGGGAAIVLMIGCMLVFKKRAGIVLLHGGVILMLLSEFITGTSAIEGKMRINAGESVNFVEHTRTVELAFIDRTDPESDHVVVIPRDRLREGGLISDPRLPVDVEVVQYMKNSRVFDATRSGPMVANPATAGAGVRAIAVEEPETSGTDTEQRVDVPSVYVNLRSKQSGQPMGTYLATPWLVGTAIERQIIPGDDRAWDMLLRFGRTYKPYRIELLEFRHDRYVGTDTPKNFSSLVRVVDEDKGVDRTVKIWMNNPLRYAGETFYQSSFEPGRQLTILQVVRNDGWMIPYISCMIVGVGMTLHMGSNLVGFLPSSEGCIVKSVTRLVPAIVAVLAIGWLAGKSVPPRDADGVARIQEFGRLPVVYQGRIKPIDTLARNSLTIVSDRQTWRDEAGEKRPAIEWALDVMSNSPRAEEHKVFRIHNLDILEQLGLERRKGFRYALAEFRPHMPEIEQQVAHAASLPQEQRDVYDAKILEFWQRIVQYRVLADTHLIPDPGRISEAIGTMQMLDRLSVPHVVPPAEEGDEWSPMLRAVLEGGMKQSPNPAVQPLAGMLTAWREGDADRFNGSLAAYEDLLATLPAVDHPDLDFEAGFNNFAPFYQCAVLYIFAFLLGCLAWLGWSEVFRRTAFWLLLVAFVGHTLAISARVYISGYPPITNLYGTAIFIGWGCVLLGLLLEWIYKLGIGNLMAAIAGFLTLLIAHFLAGDGDTLQMMQAVLDTKFWLATHVIVINFGYAATFLAGGLAVLFLLRGVLTRSLDKRTEKVFGRMIYGVLCFALLLSFVGTVLGGLWADDSWGRFWGWDPKENGALMIVLWNALILHARWGGMIKTRGIAVLSVFGNIVTAWSWFGVNQLGVGLHSYGFVDSITFWLLVFVATQLVVMAVGVLPRGMWRSRTSSGSAISHQPSGEA